MLQAQHFRIEWGALAHRLHHAGPGKLPIKLAAIPVPAGSAKLANCNSEARATVKAGAAAPTRRWPRAREGSGRKLAPVVLVDCDAKCEVVFVMVGPIERSCPNA
jgi:hypothetical protein